MQIKKVVWGDFIYEIKLEFEESESVFKMEKIQIDVMWGHKMETSFTFVHITMKPSSFRFHGGWSRMLF